MHLGGEKRREMSPVATCFCPLASLCPHSCAQQRFLPQALRWHLRGSEGQQEPARTGQNRLEPAVPHLRQPHSPLTQTLGPTAVPRSRLGLAEACSEAALDSSDIEDTARGQGVPFIPRETTPGAASPLSPAGQRAEHTQVRMAQLPCGS